MLVDRGHELNLLSETAGEAVRGVARKVGQEGCTNASLEGTAGFYRFGTIPAGSLAAVGTATYDGAGNTVTEVERKVHRGHAENGED